MATRFATLVSSTLLGLALHSGYAADKLVVNVDAENAPFMYLKDGKVEGIYPAIIVAAFSRMKVPVEVAGKPWKRTLSEIDEGKAGVAGIYKNDDRLKKYDYSEPILNENIVVYYNKAKPIAYGKVADLNGKKIGVLRGWIYSDGFDKAKQAGQLTVDEVNGDTQNFEKLNAGRLDAALAIEQSGAALIKSGKYPNVEAAKTLLDTNQGHLAFNKSGKQTEVIAKFNQAIAEMKKDGSLDKLVAQELAK